MTIQSDSALAVPTPENLMGSPLSPGRPINAARALVRPALAIGLSTFLACAFFAMAPGDIDRAYVADNLVFAAVTSIVWWFGDRAPKKSSR